MIIENCPICGNKLEVIMDKNNEFVEDWWCSNCSGHFCLEDLEVRIPKVKMDLDRWI